MHRLQCPFHEQTQNSKPVWPPFLRVQQNRMLRVRMRDQKVKWVVLELVEERRF